MSISLTSQLELVSLRVPLAATRLSEVRPAASAKRLPAALLVTVGRVPLALMAVYAIVLDMPVMAVAGFTVFAFVDLIDGIFARRRHEETAMRRITDVFVDRAAIHLAVIAVTVINGFPLWLPVLLLARDLTHALYSGWVLWCDRQVVVGPHSHMAYGLSMLGWGSVAIVSHSLHPMLLAVVSLISLTVLVDYVRRCEGLRRLTRSTR